MAKYNLTYWQRDEKKDYCLLADPEKFMRAYVRADGCLNLLFYNDEWLFDHDRHSYDWHICEIDEAIERLQAIKEMAVKYFAEKGKQWPVE